MKFICNKLQLNKFKKSDFAYKLTEISNYS